MKIRQTFLRYLLPVLLLPWANVTAQLSPVLRVKTKKAPLFATLSADGNLVFITCFASDEVVIYKKGARKAHTNFYGGFEPQGIAITPTGDKLFVTNRRGLVKVIDAQTYRILDDIKLGGVPSNIAISPTGLQVFVTNYGRGKIGRIDFIDTSTHRVVGETEVGIRPIAAAVSPLGDQLFVVCAGSADVWVIDTNTRKVIKNIPVGLGPNGLAFSSDGASLYVSNSGTNDISVIDSLDLVELRRAPVGAKPFSIAVDTAGRVLVVESGDARLSLYTPEFKKIASVKAGKRPIDVKLSPESDLVYVTDEKDNKLYVFRLDSPKISG